MDEWAAKEKSVRFNRQWVIANDPRWLRFMTFGKKRIFTMTPSHFYEP